MLKFLSYLMGNRTPEQLMAESEKALDTFRKVVSRLEAAVAKTYEEEAKTDKAIEALKAQRKAAEAKKAAYANLRARNTKRMGKVNEWLEDL